MPHANFKETRRAYGFDEVALVPGDITINPDQVDVSFKVRDLIFDIPILAAAMDGVVDSRFAIYLGTLGGMAVLNLEGVQTRYECPDEILQQIISAPQDTLTPLLQKIYAAPIKENLITARVRQIKEAGIPCVVSITPSYTKRFAPIAIEAGVDILVIQSTVTTARHISKSVRGLVFSEFCERTSVPVIVGNCVSYSAALELMHTGVEGILVGVGPGASCTTREVLGIGVPQVTATMDCAAARETYLKETGRYAAVITDGGIRTGGDFCKAIASGADAVMLGAAFAGSQESPGRGYYWGMANPHPTLPRGTRIKVGISAPLEQILFGPATVTNGTQNLVGALRTAMGVCGVSTIREMQQVEMVIAPAIKTEGKLWQLAGS